MTIKLGLSLLPEKDLEHVSLTSKSVITWLNRHQNARNFGVIFDSHLDMHSHITSTSWSTMYHLQRISSIHRGATETLIYAFISIRLDYCNSLLTGLPSCKLDCLQWVQNVAARILTFTRRCEHIRQVLYSLHWLPVSARIEFKVVTITFKCLHGMAPEYATELLAIYRPHVFLRLCERRANLISAEGRSFPSWLRNCLTHYRMIWEKQHH